MGSTSTGCWEGNKAASRSCGHEPDNRHLEDFAKADLAPRTYHNYKLQIREHIVPALGNMKLSKLDTPNIQALYTAKLQAGLKPASIRYIHAVLYCALEKAVDLRLIARSPAASARPPKIKQEEITPRR